MRIALERTLVVALLLAAAGCTVQSDTAAPKAPEASAASSAPAPSASPESASDQASSTDAGMGPGDELSRKKGLIALGAAFAAAAEQCGISTRAQNEAAFPQMRAKMIAEGVPAADIDSTFWAAYDATLAKAKQTPAAQVEMQCKQMRAMSDPKQIEKMEQATAKLKALTEKMKQRSEATPTAQ